MGARQCGVHVCLCRSSSKPVVAVPLPVLPPRRTAWPAAPPTPSALGSSAAVHSADGAAAPGRGRRCCCCGGEARDTGCREVGEARCGPASKVGWTRRSDGTACVGAYLCRLGSRKHHTPAVCVHGMFVEGKPRAGHCALVWVHVAPDAGRLSERAQDTGRRRPGLKLLEEFGTVDASYDLTPEQLIERIPGCDALIIRSATKARARRLAGASSRGAQAPACAQQQKRACASVRLRQAAAHGALLEERMT